MENIPTQDDKPTTGCVSSLSLDKEVSQTQGPSLSNQVGGGKTVCETAFTNNNQNNFQSFIS